MARVYIALGSNLGDRAAMIAAAVDSLRALEQTQVTRVSPIYETAAVGGPEEQGPFLNGVAELETELAPRSLLEALQGIEQQAGREPRSRRTHWGPRVLDLDLLLYDDQVLREPGLTVPHPGLADRWFVLKPLADLAPALVVPTLARTVGELLARQEGRS